MTPTNQTAEQPKTLEQLIEGGEVAHALLLKGGWSKRDVDIILNAYQVGIDAGLALCAKRSHEPPRNSGEGTAVNGPMPLAGGDDAEAPAGG